MDYETSPKKNNSKALLTEQQQQQQQVKWRRHDFRPVSYGLTNLEMFRDVSSVRLFRAINVQNYLF